jgi:anthranilate phosphoribosyltransferase
MSGENRVALLRQIGGDPSARLPSLGMAMVVLAQAHVTVMFGKDSIVTTQGEEVFLDDYGWDIPLAVEALAQQVANRRTG